MRVKGERMERGGKRERRGGGKGRSLKKNNCIYIFGKIEKFAVNVVWLCRVPFSVMSITPLSAFLRLFARIMRVSRG